MGSLSIEILFLPPFALTHYTSLLIIVMGGAVPPDQQLGKP